jgi:putative component of toxin-antitoxin plasmid stabilization module
MSIFDKKNRIHQGEIHDLYILKDCAKKLKKSGVWKKVISRAFNICETGHFGQEGKRFKYKKTKNIGWLKWEDGTRVYFSKFMNNKILLFTISGNKNNQDADINEALELKKEIENELKKEN